MRASAARTSGACAVLLLALTTSCDRFTAAVGPRVPPDNSLTIDGYIAAGLPDPREPWGRHERADARAALMNVQESDPSRLPRFGSKASGFVFLKLLNEELEGDPLEGPLGQIPGFDFDQLEAADLAGLARQGSMFFAYTVAAESGLMFDREAVAIANAHVSDTLADRMRLRESFAELSLEEQRNPSLTDAAELARELGQISLVTTLSKLAEFSSSEAMSPTARNEAARHLRAQLPKARAILTPEAKAELNREIRRSAARPPAHPELRILLREPGS